MPTTLDMGLNLLLQTSSYTADLNCDPWDLAVERGELLKLGVTISDMRWLVCKGWVEVGRELTLPGDPNRSFRRCKGLSIPRRACFILTTSGREIVDEYLARPAVAGRTDNSDVQQERSIVPTQQSVSPEAPPVPDVLPKWDADRHELSLNGEIVKCFKLPSQNQEAVLMAFHEEGWPARIDDPLPPVAEVDPKRRLQDTIKSLNRCQKSRCIRFSGDGTGEGVLWRVQR
ncbi:MAG: hypothetical protein KDB23_03220 [Planctomycetales bacterium]|nr:hypothetical protein [Planctomycetales bacterium]